MFVLPLVILGAVTTYIAGAGLASAWSVPFPSQYVIAAALHAAYALRAARINAALTAISWLTCLYLAWTGLAAMGSNHPIVAATVLETICLLLARPNAVRVPVSDRLAGWRREQAQIAVQLRMGEGILPWTRRCVRQAIGGAPETAAGYEHLRLAAIMADSENRLHTNVAKMAMPEHLRQSLLTSAASIAARAEASAGERAIEMERLVLEAAAACRDECSQIESLPPAERQALAERCERALLELAHH